MYSIPGRSDAARKTPIRIGHQRAVNTDVNLLIVSRRPARDDDLPDNETFFAVKDPPIPLE
jgi:hypothetical protein